MAPERSPKRQKTSIESQSSSTTSNQASELPTTPVHTPPNGAEGSQQRSSWYASWSRKAPPITQLARESIQSASSTVSETASSIKDISTVPKTVRSPSLAMTLGKGRSSRSSLVDATTTMVHAEVKGPAHDLKKTQSNSSVEPPQQPDTPAKKKSEESNPDVDSGTEATVTRKEEGTSQTEIEKDLVNPRSSWLGWLGKADISVEDHSKVNPIEESSTSQNQTTPPSAAQETSISDLGKDVSQQEVQPSRKSWLPIWSGTNDSTSQGKVSAVDEPKQLEIIANNGKNTETTDGETQVEQQTSRNNSSAPQVEAALPPSLPHDSTRASGWAFWSRERKANSSNASVDGPHEGEIAVSDTPSQSQPRRTSISVPETKEPKKIEPKKSAAPEDTSKAASVSKKPEDVAIKAHKKQDSKAEVVISKAESSNATAIATEPSTDKRPASVKSAKGNNNNLLLPTLHATLKLPESPSILLRLASLLYASKEPELKHLSLIKDPPRIKSALAIGVHGYFPAPLIRTVLGQPTGTSIKFADRAARSIKKWTSAHGYDCDVKTAALEGEGKIADRLELLWKLLLNWIDEIRKSDFVMIACHSQGVPVAIMLVAKLIQFGCVNAARIGICAMAGVNMGPFQEYKSRWIGGSAGELFEFSDPTTRVSTDYLAALETVLQFGVRLTFIGSIDDQLVSLESSIFSPLSHPHIFRAVSIDSRIHAPNFLSHLVGFALKLRNLGVQDHGLIRELSSPLAGSLYTGEGHSRIYEDDAVYDLAVSFALETSSLVGMPITQRTPSSGGSNPYILPFAMRGILEEDFVKNELQSEASDLLKEFDEWKPASKALKDVKFRLEGIRSKL